MYPVRVQVRLFGTFRKYSEADLSFDLPRGTPVSALRRKLAEALRRKCPTFSDQALLEVSVIADDDHILQDSEPIGRGLDHVAVAVLPPVCGG